MIRLNAYKLVLRAVSFPRVLVMLLFHRPALIPKLPQAAALLPGPPAIPSRPRCRWSPTLRWPGALRSFVSFRQGCVRPSDSRFLFGQEAADGGSADLKLARDLGFAD